MNRKISFFAVMIIISMTAFGQHEKSIYHARKVSPYVVRITCDNSADPTVVTDPKLRAILGDGLLVLCGDMRHPITLKP